MLIGYIKGFRTYGLGFLVWGLGVYLRYIGIDGVCTKVLGFYRDNGKS